jgi:hypothetical protein
LQLFESVCRLTSQPSAAAPLQSAKFALQVNPHWPAPEHVAAALAFEGHATAFCHCAFKPQVWVPAPEHRIAPGTHTPVQLPAEQAYGHVEVVCQLPAESQVCAPSPEHCIDPGTHWPPQEPAPEHTYGQVWSVTHCPEALHC